MIDNNKLALALKKLIIILLLFSIAAQVAAVFYMERCSTTAVKDVDEKNDKDSKTDKKEDKTVSRHSISFPANVLKPSFCATTPVSMYPSPLVGKVFPPPDAHVFFKI